MIMTMVERLTRERRREQTRDLLVSAAAEVFSEKGYAGASLDEIAERAGYTRGAIYPYFSGKEDLLFAVTDRHLQEQLEMFSDAMGDPADDPTTRAGAAGDLVARMGVGYDLLTVELELAARRNPELRARLVEHDRAAVAEVTRFIEEMFEQQNATLKIPAADLAAIGRAASDGLLRRAALDPEHADEHMRLVRTLFVLLAELVVQPDPAKPSSE